MFTMKLCILPLVILTLKVSYSAQANPCCKGENIFHNKRCIDGTVIDGVTCSSKYLRKNGDNNMTWTIRDNGHLVYEDVEIPPDRYCHSKFNNSDQQIFLICFEEESYWEYNFAATLEFISVIFIIFTIFVYTQLSELLDLQGICIIHSITGLATTFLVLGMTKVISVSLEGVTCLVSAYTIYFAGLYTFFWLNALSFHIWKTIVNPSVLTSIKRWKLIYHLYGIGGPLILAFLLVAAHHYLLSDYAHMHPGFGEGKCWFKSVKTQFIYFYGPICALIMMNVIYYVWVIIALCKEMGKCDEKKLKVLKYRLLLCVKLFFIMGLSWIFEVLSAAFSDYGPLLDVLWNITDFLNSLQGILIFLILILFRKRVIRLLASRKICGLRLPGRWKTITDEECDDLEEEINLSEAQTNKS